MSIAIAVADWVRFITFPPFILLYIMGVVGFFIIGNPLGTAIAACVWMALMINYRTLRLIMAVTDKMPWVR